MIQDFKQFQGETKFIEWENVQVKIPDCCRNGGKITNPRTGVIEDCPHIVQKKRLKKGNVGL